MSHYSSLSLPPLHVRVAEALGCRPFQIGQDWTCVCPNHGHTSVQTEFLRRYDLDWAATGPLIEALQIEIVPPGDPDGGTVWTAAKWRPAIQRDGATLLTAVCELIVALAEAGKLDLESLRR